MATVVSESHLPAVDKHCHEEVGRELQRTLVDLVDLSLLGKQLPWPGPSSATTSRTPTPPGDAGTARLGRPSRCLGTGCGSTRTAS
jgi:hypothetical protein